MGIKLYRAKRDHAGEGPVCEPSARGLGVRPLVDVPTQEGLVWPGTGGLAVAPRTPENLAVHRRPPVFGGTGKDPIWVLDVDSLGDSLTFREDRVNYGVIEPAQAMSFEEFNAALSELAPRWKKL